MSKKNKFEMENWTTLMAVFVTWANGIKAKGDFVLEELIERINKLADNGLRAGATNAHRQGWFNSLKQDGKAFVESHGFPTNIKGKKFEPKIQKVVDELIIPMLTVWLTKIWNIKVNHPNNLKDKNGKLRKYQPSTWMAVVRTRQVKDKDGKVTKEATKSNPSMETHNSTKLNSHIEYLVKAVESGEWNGTFKHWMEVHSIEV